MTSAKHNDARALLAERFGEDLVPLEGEATGVDAGARARFVAMLHAVIAWFIDHPEIPVPRTVQLHARVADMGELERLADMHGVALYGQQPQFDITLSPHDTGTLTSLIVAPRLEDRPL
jgi:hypothetical protein